MGNFQKRVLQRFSNRPDTEHEQAIVRLIIAVLILVYLSALRIYGSGNHDTLHWPMVILLAESIIGLAIVVSLALTPQTSHPRRLLGMVADYLTLGALMSIGGAILAPLYVIYLWVTVGNGLRYGYRYLQASAAMATASFLLVIQTTPYWLNNRPLAWGLLIGLVAIPAYITSLLKALTSARDEARRANNAKSQFLATMSHEFRTPLNGIVSAATLIASSRLTAEQRENSDILQASAQSLLALVEDVLDISKIESGKLVQVHADFSLAQLLRSVELVLLPVARGKNLSLTVDIADDVPAWLNGDSDHLRQIVTNLVSNAVKFTERGSVSVVVESLPLEDSTSAKLRFSIRDTGIGIALDAQARVFDAFEQADQGHSRRFGGTGLGTTIAKSLVELMGGDIGMESEQGVGSNFWFTVQFAAAQQAAVQELPALQEEAQIAMSPASTSELVTAPLSAPSRFKPRMVSSSTAPARVFDIDDPFVRHRALGLGPMKILVADDQPANIAILCRLLEKAGHRFHQVQSGEEVLTAIENASYDCAIIDLHMPGCNGLDIIRQARVMEAGCRQTPFVILTADATTRSREECNAAGARAFLTKPIVVATLLETLRDIAAENAAAASLSAKANQVSHTAIDLVSMTAVQELRHMGLGDSFLQLFINECQADAFRCLTAMETALADSDWQGLREHSHALKGVAANMAAFRLADDATELMNLSTDVLRRDARKRIKALQWCLSATKIALLEIMVPLQAAQIDRRVTND